MGLKLINTKYENAGQLESEMKVYIYIYIYRDGYSVIVCFDPSNLGKKSEKVFVGYTYLAGEWIAQDLFGQVDSYEFSHIYGKILMLLHLRV